MRRDGMGVDVKSPLSSTATGDAQLYLGVIDIIAAFITTLTPTMLTKQI